MIARLYLLILRTSLVAVLSCCAASPKSAVPSPVQSKCFLPGLEAPLALSPVQTTSPDPDLRMMSSK